MEAEDDVDSVVQLPPDAAESEAEEGSAVDEGGGASSKRRSIAALVCLAAVPAVVGVGLIVFLGAGLVVFSDDERNEVSSANAWVAEVEDCEELLAREEEGEERPYTISMVKPAPTWMPTTYAPTFELTQAKADADSTAMTARVSNDLAVEDLPASPAGNVIISSDDGGSGDDSSVRRDLRGSGHMPTSRSPSKKLRRLQCEELLARSEYSSGDEDDDLNAFLPPGTFDFTFPMEFPRQQLDDGDNETAPANSTDTTTPAAPAPTALPNRVEDEPPAKASSTLVASPECVGGMICLQNSDFEDHDEAGFNIDLSLEMLDPSNADAYASARKKWMEMIAGDLPSATPVHPTLGDVDVDNCVNDLPELIDDLHICARDEVQDGEGGVVGAAGPLYLRRDETTRKYTTITGQMRFDVADVASLVQHGVWEDVIMHEMGHVMGIGTLWYLNGLVDRSTLNYLGTNAVNVWKNEWGCESTDTPPVEKDGRPGDGTYGGHWDEGCLRNEFMTGMADQHSNPISNLTIASVEDVGYEVDYAVAEEYDTSNAYCCNGNGGGMRGLRGNDRAPRKLSDEGRAAAIAHGREVLRENKLQRRPDTANDGPVIAGAMSPWTEDADYDGTVYVGDRLVVVLFEEEGHIYDIIVTRDE